MRDLRSRGTVCLAVALLALAPMLASAAMPNTNLAGSPTATWRTGVEVWLARLLPSWLTAASETAPPPEPAPPEGLELDDSTNDLCSSPEDPGCTGTDLLPDTEPDG